MTTGATAATPDPLATARAWREAGFGVAIASVIATWGSAPRPAGSLLAIRADGAFEGSVSGGCVEGAVIAEAEAVIASRAPRLLDYGVSDAKAWEVGLACGGRIRILLEVMEDGLLDRLQGLRAAKQPVALIATMARGSIAVYNPEEDKNLVIDGIELGALAREALRHDKAQSLEEKGATYFLNPFNPPLRLILVGAVHIAQALAPMAALAGYEVVIIDPRTAFASPQRFPATAYAPPVLRHDWPDEALAALAPDQRSAVVTLSHDPKLDDPALIAALASPAFYVGALGSRKTHAARRARLIAAGLDEGRIGRIHAPVGLAIGARAPAEIALAILAQMTAALRGAAP
ncbi:MAG: XdhC family protein [Pseudomonadota bacterium]